jgi:hydrogenase maturation protein HypF
VERRSIAIRGIVQGVGFRPFVYGLASRLNLRGFVKNRTGDVLIEVEGDSSALNCFLQDLCSGLPPLAHIDCLSWATLIPLGESAFRIEPSEADTSGQIFISPDVATCDDCLKELFDSKDRRYRYPFINCTNCGPRLTIVTGAPYDRARTTMASFDMCPECRKEYEDPSDRRFHAQPTACAACGPKLQLLDSSGKQIDSTDPLRDFASALRRGQIGALKGLGGFHLACDATQSATVALLRRRKHRDEKPFAIMVRDLESAQRMCNISQEEAELIASPPRPIVLLRRKASTNIAEGIAPRNPYLGIMLPYTPLHHLLLHEVDGLPLVMTQRQSLG